MRADAPACPPKARLIEHDHRQAFRRAINRGGETGGTGADHGNIIEFFRIEFGRDAETGAGFGIARALEQRAVRADHQRQFVLQNAEAFDRRARLLVGRDIEHRIRIAVAREKALDAYDVGRIRVPDQQRAGAAFLDQRHAAQDEGAHHDLAQFGRADHQRADMGGIVWQRGAAFVTGAAGSDGAETAQLADLAGKLPGPERNDRGFAVQPVAPHDLQPAFDDQPGRGIAGADVINLLAGRKSLRRAAGKTPGGLALDGVEHRKHLVKTVGGLAHYWLLAAAPLKMRKPRGFCKPDQRPVT